MLKVTLFLRKQKEEKFAPNRRVAGKRTLRRKLRKPAGRTGKMPNYLLKRNRPRKLATKEEDERDGQALQHRQPCREPASPRPGAGEAEA